METKAESILCNQLIHVVCLPFRITAEDDQREICLEEIAKTLEGSPWTTGAAPDPEAQCDWGRFRCYQARAYFHPFVRRFLYDTKRVLRYHRSDIKRIEVVLDSYATKQFSAELKVQRCELVLFQPDIGALLLEVSPTTVLSLQQAQLLLDAFRRLYPPYIDHIKDLNTWAGGHCPVEVTLLDENEQSVGEQGKYRDPSAKFMTRYTKVLLADTEGKGTADRPQYPWAEHWRSLLQPFVCYGEAGPGFQALQLGDDRAPILTWIAFDDPRAVDRGNWMRLCFADPPGTDQLPYAGGFTADFEERYCYDRFWYEPGESTDAPSRILNCGYAFCYAGKDNDPDFFTNPNNGAHAIFRHIHVEMGMIAHFQKAALLSAAQRVSELVTRKGNAPRLPDQKQVRKFYDHFVEFTQNFWFDEITPQHQGQELFQQWREHLRIQELYDEVHQELKDLVDYTELRASGVLNGRLSFIAGAGFFIAFAALFAGVFGMNELEPGHLPWLVDYGLRITLGLAAIILIVGLYVFLKRNPS